MEQRKQATEVQLHGRPGLTPQPLIRATNVSPEAKAIYGLLSSYKEAFPGQKWIAGHCPASVPTVVNRLHELEARGWLFREERNRRAGETDVYHIFMAPLSLERRREWVLGLHKTAQEIDEMPARTLLNVIKLIPRVPYLTPFIKSRLDKKLEKRKRSLKKETEKETSPSTDSGIVDPAEAVIRYLNEKAGKHYPPSKTSLKPIHGRLASGATVEMLELVIDFKAAEWLGGGKMVHYLRPQTLFGPENFEGYLVEARGWDERGRPPLRKQTAEEELQEGMEAARDFAGVTQ